MNNTRVKTFLIICLVAVNVFLLVVNAVSLRQAGYIPAKTVDSALTLLSSRGVELPGSEVDRRLLTLKFYEFQSDRDTWRQTVTDFTGAAVDSESVIPGGAVRLFSGQYIFTFGAASDANGVAFSIDPAPDSTPGISAQQSTAGTSDTQGALAPPAPQYPQDSDYTDLYAGMTAERRSQLGALVKPQADRLGLAGGYAIYAAYTGADDVYVRITRRCDNYDVDGEHIDLHFVSGVFAGCDGIWLFDPPSAVYQMQIADCIDAVFAAADQLDALFGPGVNFRVDGLELRYSAVIHEMVQTALSYKFYLTPCWYIELTDLTSGKTYQASVNAVTGAFVAFS